MIIGPDPLDFTHSAWTETCPRTIGDTEIHGNANERNVETAELLLMRCSEQGWYPGVRQFALSPATKEAGSRLLERRVKDIITLGVLIFPAQSCEFMGIHYWSPL